MVQVPFQKVVSELDFIHPLIFTDFYVKGLNTLQIAIKGKKSFEFRAVIDKKDKTRIIKEISEKLNLILKEKKFTQVKYEIKILENLSSDKKTGKFRLIIDETK